MAADSFMPAKCEHRPKARAADGVWPPSYSSFVSLLRCRRPSPKSAQKSGACVRRACSKCRANFTSRRFGRSRPSALPLDIDGAHPPPLAAFSAIRSTGRSQGCVQSRTGGSAKFLRCHREWSFPACESSLSAIMAPNSRSADRSPLPHLCYAKFLVEENYG